VPVHARSASAVAQLRLSGKVVGQTAVEAGMRVRGCWGENMQATLAGRPGAGFFYAAYGAEVGLKARIHTSVLGRSINWEGNIPLPYIPMDLLLEGQTAFDPAIDPTKIARVFDATDPITLLTTDVIGQFISITGISGGLKLTVAPTMATSFRVKKAKLDGGTLDSPDDKVTLDGPFGSGRDVPLQVEGVVRYEPALRFGAGFQVKILGISVVDWTIATISMPLPALERAIKLTGDPARLPLPVLEGIGDGARMDFATGTVQELRVKNLGGGTLSIEPQAAAGALISRLDIPPGGEDVLRVYVADPTVFADGPLDVTLATSDPDRGTVSIQLGREVGGTDAGTPPDDGTPGGCSASRGAAGLAPLFALLLIRRRRRYLA
jgi:hypothetical protein